jgi:hypothetical protein
MTQVKFSNSGNMLNKFVIHRTKHNYMYRYIMLHVYHNNTILSTFSNVLPILFVRTHQGSNLNEELKDQGQHVSGILAN